MLVKFYDSIDDALIKFVVIISRCGGKWVLCRHKDRSTFEFPGGHRENDEAVLSAAKRELYEETGAIEYEINKICVYSVTGKNFVNKAGDETFGALFYADVFRFENELHNEIAEILLFEKIPENWTYPLIQPVLFDKFLKIRDKKSSKK